MRPRPEAVRIHDAVTYFTQVDRQLLLARADSASTRSRQPTATADSSPGRRPDRPRLVSGGMTMNQARVIDTRKSDVSFAWGMLPVYLMSLAVLFGCAPDLSESSPNATGPSNSAAESPFPGTTAPTAAASERPLSYEFPSDATPEARAKRLAEMKSLRFQGIFRVGPNSARNGPPTGILTICSPLGPLDTSPQQLAMLSESYTFVPGSTVGYAVRYHGLAKIDLETGRFKQVLEEGLRGQRIHRIAFDTKRKRVVL